MTILLILKMQALGGEMLSSSSFNVVQMCWQKMMVVSFHFTTHAVLDTQMLFNSSFSMELIQTLRITGTTHHSTRPQSRERLTSVLVSLPYE